MKPSFALRFSQDSVGLLHRLSDGWSSLGSVRFDDPDLMDSLGALRGQVQDIAPDGFGTLLILPNSEVLYTSTDAGDDPSASREARVTEALEGRTPYGIDELAYDWTEEGTGLRIAAVARETLSEAESFAQDYRFNPVAFAAVADEAQFPRMAWFGLTPAAEALPEAEQPQRETTFAFAGGDAAAPEALAALPVAAPEVIAPEPEEAVAELTPAPQAEAEDLHADPLPAPETEAARPAEPEPESVTLTLPEAEDATPAPDATDGAEPAPEAGFAAPEAEAPAEVSEAEPRTADSEDDALHPAPAEDLAEAVPEATATEPEPAAPLSEPAADALSDADLLAETGGTSPAARLLAELATRPAASAAAAESPAVSAAVAAPAPGSAASPASLAARLAAATAAGSAEVPAAPRAPASPLPPDDQASISEVIAAESDPAELTESWPGDADDILAGTKAALAASLNPTPAAMPPARTGPAAPVVAPAATPERVKKAMEQVSPRRRAAPPPVARPAGAEAAATPRALRPGVKPAASEAEAMTVYGKRSEGRRGRPRYLGLALTGGLLLLLLVVAIWAAIFLESPADQGAARSPAGDEAEVYLTEADLLPSPGTDPEPGAEARPLTLAEEAAPAAAPAPATLTATESAAAPAAPEPVTESLAEAGPAVTAPAPVAAAPASAPAPAPLVEELTVPAGETPVAALAAPLPVQTAAAGAPDQEQDPAPGPAPALPAFNALYQFDAEGRIIPTAEGVVTPDGIRLVAARPDRLPPSRPESLTAAALQQSTEVAGAAAALAAQVTDSGTTAEGFEPDSRLTRFRPRTRPASAPGDQSAVAEPAAAAVAEVVADPALADVPQRRPAARSATAVAAARQAEEAEKARSLAEAAAAAASAASLVSAESGLSATRRPAARPEALARAATAPAALQAAAITAPPQTRQTGRAAVSNPRDDSAEDDDGEPEITRAAPSIPTRASVARQATLTRAINLAQVNLIGVFGTTSQRYALVREGGGRVVRVRVGDRVDGGRVTAISTNSLSYQKGGSVRQLALPRG